MARSGVLETPRLLIEPFGLKHLTARYVSWLNDPGITRFSEQRLREHSLESCRAYLEAFEGTPHYLWAVLARERALAHIGNLNAYIDLEHNLADVGILFGEAEARGMGLATEAWLAVCDHLLRGVGIRKVTAGTIAPNVAMMKLMERTHMVGDGRRVGHHLWNGQAVDVVYAAFFRETWLEIYPCGPFPAQVGTAAEEGA